MSGDREPAVRLTPPPRADSGGPGRPPAPPERGRGWAVALTTGGLLALVALAGSVFVLLPRWVESRPSVAQRSTAPSADTPGVPGELPAEAPPVTPERPGPPPEDPSQPIASIPADVDTGGGSNERRAPGPPLTSSVPPPAVSPPAPVDRPPPGPREFDRAMGEGLAALAGDDPVAAQAAFARAQALEPGSTPAAEGLARAEEALRSRRIAAHREAAVEHVEAERWSRALAEHEAALALDPTLEFARAGAERARRRADLDARLGSHLSRPERLSSTAVRREVSELIERARAIEPAGPRLSEQTARLTALLERAVRRIEVVLESDELTEVTVYRVGSLGRFRRKALELMPGTYVVVGRRSGYRDVRRELVVGEASPATLTVRCEEKI